MIKTVEGKVLVWLTATGQQIERWPVDAKLLVNNGEARFDPPDGVEGPMPPTPPARVGVPAPVVVATPGSGDPGDPLAKGKGK